jgi:hypothetical protein
MIYTGVRVLHLVYESSPQGAAVRRGKAAPLMRGVMSLSKLAIVSKAWET